MDNLLIHIGYPKTATTWLQKYVFSRPEVGFYSPWGDRAGIAIEQFVLTSPFAFEPEQARVALRDAVRMAPMPGIIPVLSEETLVGDPCSGHYWGRTAADKLYRTFPDAKIVITIREQRAFILSAYKQYVRTGGTASLERFIGRGEDKLPLGVGGICRLNALEYDQAIDYYRQLFGADRVMVLVYEELLANPQKFLLRLTCFAGAKGTDIPPISQKPNKSERGATTWFRRPVNRYVPQPDFALRNYPFAWRALCKLCEFSDRYVPATMHRHFDRLLADRIMALIGDEFSNSNRKTELLLDDIDLEALGYPIMGGEIPFLAAQQEHTGLRGVAG